MGFGANVPFTPDNSTVELTSGGILRVKDSGITLTKLSFKTESLVQTQTVSGLAVTDVTFSSLDINTDGNYQLIGKIIPAGAGTNLEIFTNGDTTTTNYYNEQVIGNAGVVSSARQNSAMAGQINSAGETLIVIDIALINGYATWFARSNLNKSASVQTMIVSGNKTGTVANITSLTLHSVTASSIGVGSTFNLYKLNV